MFKWSATVSWCVVRRQWRNARTASQSRRQCVPQASGVLGKRVDRKQSDDIGYRVTSGAKFRFGPRKAEGIHFAVTDRIDSDFSDSPSRFRFEFVGKPYRLKDEVRTLSRKRRMLTATCSVAFQMLLWIQATA